MIPLALSLKFALFFCIILEAFPLHPSLLYDLPDVVAPIHPVYLIVPHQQVVVLVVIVDVCPFVVGLHRGSCLGHVHIT